MTASLSYGQGSALPTPTNLAAQITTTPSYGVALSWNAQNGPWFFRVYRSTGDSLNFGPIGYTLSRKYHDREVAALQTYYYAVRAVDTLLREGPRSAAASVTTGQTPLQVRGTISGMVLSDASGDSLNGVMVRFFRVGPVTRLSCSTLTDSLGLYRASLDTGSYLVNAVRIPTGANSALFEPEWYQNAKSPASATTVVLTENATISVNFGLAAAVLPDSAHVRGVVRDNLGNPLPGANVAVFRTIQEMHRFAARYGIPPWFGPEAEELPGLGYVKGVVWTGVSDAQAGYDALVRKSRSYIAIAWKAGYVPEYYFETSDPTRATILTLQGDTSGISFTLDPVGGATSTVSGTVKSPEGDAVVSRVILFPRPNGTQVVEPAVISTDPNGEYEVTGVPAGTYYVYAVPYSGYSAAYYHSGTSGAGAWQEADSVVVAGDVSNINVVVEPVASSGTVTVSGSVELSSGSPVQGASVFARTADGAVVGYGMTDGDGTFVLEAVPQGALSVEADRIGYAGDLEDAITPAGVYEKGGVKLVLGSVVGVPHGEGVPIRPELLQNYPNPFNPSTQLAYSLAVRGLVLLKVFDILGRELETLVNEEQNPGRYQVRFDALNLAAGVYYYQLRVSPSAPGRGGEFLQTRAMVLVR
jgi:hypothetical protein